jgi:hypothetical protein
MEGTAGTMPTQPIAARTGPKAVLGGLCTALLTLDDMIHFLVGVRFLDCLGRFTIKV